MVTTGGLGHLYLKRGQTQTGAYIKGKMAADCDSHFDRSSKNMKGQHCNFYMLRSRMAKWMIARCSRLLQDILTALRSSVSVALWRLYLLWINMLA